MKLICPGCGLTASVEAWLNDAEARELLAAGVKLPPPLPEVTLPYLGLFRPEERALAWKKATRLLAKLSQLVVAGHVQVQGKPARPCPPRIWAAAMSRMIDQRQRISRPLPNHNYLRQVAWQLADLEDALGEKSRNEQERNGNLRSYETAPMSRPRSINPLDKLMGRDSSDLSDLSYPSEANR